MHRCRTPCARTPSVEMMTFILTNPSGSTGRSAVGSTKANHCKGSRWPLARKTSMTPILTYTYSTYKCVCVYTYVDIHTHTHVGTWPMSWGPSILYDIYMYICIYIYIYIDIWPYIYTAIQNKWPMWPGSYNKSIGM